MAFSSPSLLLSLRSFYSARPILPPLLPKPPAFSSNLLRSHPHHFGAPPKASTEGAAMAQKIFDTEEALMVSLAKYTADLSHKFSVKRGSFSLVLSGGSLVKSLRKLVEPPYMDSVEWSKWHVFWLDEKTIPKDQDGCNYKLAYDYFLSQVPLLPGNVYAINEALSAEGATDDYETCLRHLVKCGVIDMSTATGLPKFDLMLIGMDPDGHIASAFTDHPFLQEDNGKWVTFIHESPKLPIDIITLTLPVINSSAHMAIVSTSGHQAISTSNSVKNSGDLDGKMPIQWVSPEGELTWFLTGDAAETVGEKCV
ncbi:probable 6-phosphogluconolactonase 4, chloroplastic [Cucurbita maxima]|uniref:Probable 6-phosphogluconolactonase n=1 Tax=Cucurbita maxima TaxID=3661 RepID=A0A6J1J9Y0_CUCMA|nr:probable 6-phosphogluconolactonase 4, chloroplastic [Cucurbita maxima]